MRRDGSHSTQLSHPLAARPVGVREQKTKNYRRRKAPEPYASLTVRPPQFRTQGLPASELTDT
jgi:hypothetical protein